jgi:predicted nucleic acid-binding protein
MILADTDVLVDFLAGVEPGASRVQMELEHGQLFTTPINRFELLSGSRSARQGRLIRQLLDAVPCVAIDQAMADQAAELHRGLAQVDTVVSMNVCLIAAIALRHRAQLLTREREAFAGIPDVAFASFAVGE